MKNISDKVEEALKNQEQVLAERPEIARMQELFARLVQAGVITKREYTIPLVDTIGHNVGGAIRYQRSERPK
jgi:hypothetical protein